MYDFSEATRKTQLEWRVHSYISLQTHIHRSKCVYVSVYVCGEDALILFYYPIWVKITMCQSALHMHTSLPTHQSSYKMVL